MVNEVLAEAETLLVVTRAPNGLGAHVGHQSRLLGAPCLVTGEARCAASSLLGRSVFRRVDHATVREDAAGPAGAPVAQAEREATVQEPSIAAAGTRARLA